MNSGELRERVARELYGLYGMADEKESWETILDKDYWLKDANYLLSACKVAGLKFVDYKLPCTIPYETAHIKVEEIEL